MKIYNRFTKTLLMEVINVKTDLQGADLRRADLHGADLHGADLQGANLCNCNLHLAKITFREKIIQIKFEEQKS